MPPVLAHAAPATKSFRNQLFNMKRLFTLIFIAALAVCAQDLKAGGGPDAYGYVWLASTDLGGPTPMWVDTNANWMQVSNLADDNSVGPFNMFFDFRFYWGDYNSFKIGSNGWISFANVGNIAHCFPTIPSPGGAGDLYVAPLMSDLNFSSSFTQFPNPAEVWYWTNLKDSLVVSYYNVPWWQNGTPDWYGSNTFQVLFDATDSSITFTYRDMNPQFTDNVGCNSDIVIGIENSTGNVGLQCYPTEFLPTDSFAIKFFYPPTPLLSVKDLTPEWNQNLESGGEFFPNGLISSLTSNIKNVGNDTVSTSINVTGTIRNLANQTVYTSNATLPGLDPGEDSLVTFLPQANVTAAGQYYYEVATVNPNDINPGNNNRSSEVVMVDLTGTTAQLTYCTGSPPTGSLGWNGGQLDDGVGVYQKPPTYPVTISSLEYYISSATTTGYIAAIYDDNGPNGGPGTLLYVDTIPATSVTTGAWNTVNLSSTVTINSGGYYVAWLMGGPSIFIATEDVGPISRRSYEILSGQWAPYRENTLRDFLIRVNITNFPCSVSSGFNFSSSNTTYTFSNQSVGGTSFAWDFGDGNTSTATSPVHTYATTGTYTVCLIASSTCGADTVCQTFTVSCPAPSASFTNTATGITAQFNDGSTGGVNAWLWDFGDGGTSTQQNPIHSYPQPGTYTVCLIATSPCGSDTTCASVTVCALPVSNFTQTQAGQTVSFTNLSSAATNYAWTFGDGNTSTQQSPTHTYTGTGIYTVCLVASNTCDSDSFCAQINVCALPGAAFTSSAQANPQQIAFTDQSTGPVTSWFWDFGDGQTSGQQNPTNTYAAAGQYTVCLTVTDTCGSDTTCQTVNVNVTPGVDPGEAIGVSVWPNPAQDRVSVKVDLTNIGDLRLRITDMAGRELMRLVPDGMAREWQQQLDVSALARGMYFLEVGSGDAVRTVKVMVD
jgi:PKD repeat protein